MQQQLKRMGVGASSEDDQIHSGIPKTYINYF